MIKMMCLDKRAKRGNRRKILLFCKSNRLKCKSNNIKILYRCKKLFKNSKYNQIKSNNDKTPMSIGTKRLPVNTDEIVINDSNEARVI